MVLLVKASIDPISADLDSVAAGLNAAWPETRGCPDRAGLKEVVNRSQKLGITVRERKFF
jgi:hypothetical protein